MTNTNPEAGKEEAPLQLPDIPWPLEEDTGSELDVDPGMSWGQEQRAQWIAYLTALRGKVLAQEPPERRPHPSWRRLGTHTQVFKVTMETTFTRHFLPSGGCIEKITTDDYIHANRSDKPPKKKAKVQELSQEY